MSPNPPEIPPTSPNATTHVHTLESNQQITDPENPTGNPCVSFRHSGWSTVRKRVHAALSRVWGESDRLNRWRACGSNAWVQRHRETEQYRIVASLCHSRWCLPCQLERGRTIANAIAGYTRGKQIRFITLTLKHSGQPLTEQLAHLYDSFRRLRRTKLWKATVWGGLAICELTISSIGQWHPHLHVMVTGRYIVQAELSKAWKAATGDSHIIDIRLARDPASVGAYLTKYVTKGVHHSIYRNPDWLEEAIVAMHGRKLCLTFGSWRGLKLTREHATDGSSEDWQTIGSLRDLLTRAASGDSATQTLLQTLRTRQATIPDAPEPEEGVDTS